MYYIKIHEVKMITLNENRKMEKYTLVRDMYENAGISAEELAKKWNVEKRTIYRWIEKASMGHSKKKKKCKKKRGRPRKYPDSVFKRIIKLKTERPERSAKMIRRILKGEFPEECPSLSSIDKFLRKQGLSRRRKDPFQGYSRFVRNKPNDLWQIDIAGYQMLAHLGRLYLIGIIDDCSRFIVGAEYFKSEESKNIIIVLRDAFMAYGRPNQILSDNGTQFKNIHGELNTRYSNLLASLGIEPIYSKPYHPQSKGKIERWFKTIQDDFLCEIRGKLEEHPNWTLTDINMELKKWIKWYNFEHEHRSLPDKVPPQKVFFDREERVYRPLKTEVNWDLWINDTEERKVKKTNEVSYKGQLFKMPIGHVHQRITVIEFEKRIEIYSKEGQLLITHPYVVDVDKVLSAKQRKKHTRKISKDGYIRYKKRHFTIDYKLAGLTVEVKESNLGRTLLVYLHGKLIKEFEL
ncbi:MAG: transposase [Promethearchaeota archaeon]|nr:MAG: transposase [Candidatus Lokiarchaeota archaeon]